MATYNVTAQTRRVQYTGDGTAGNFAFSFQINATSELKVYVDSTEKTETTHYTVTLNSVTGAGTVAFTSGNFPTSSQTVTLLSDIPLSRTSIYTSGGQLTASSLEDDFDTNMFIHQQTNEEIDRSLRLAEHDVISGADMTLPVKATRAGKILGFNETTGNPEASILTADAQSLADIASDIATLADIEDGTDATDAIQTVAGISSNVSTVSGISSNVTTVAGISSDVTAVVADQADIGTVATNIASVNTVATNIADVITVANDLNEAVSELETVANDLNEATSEIDTVANSISNVDAVGTNISNVNTVAGISSNVTTVAGVSANVTTVAGVSSDVTTVAGISSNVTTVANNDANITTVAGSIADITTVQAVDTDITTVAGQISPTNNISTVAGIASNITTVAGISTDVTAVSAISTDVSAVENIKTNVTTVAGVSSDVTTVAGISGNVTTVAGISSNVSTVAGISANVTTVAGDTTAINAVANDATDIGTVATNIANVNTVAGISANVTTVAGDTANIGTLATNLNGTDTIGTVAGSISNVNSVGGSITNVNTVATNLASVNSFADTYRIGATDPTTSLDTGDLFYNTTSSTLKVYSGSAWEQGVTAGSGFLPLTGGGLTGNITFSGSQTVDGRDLSVDGAKLDGIESGATADQTASEIRTLVESATDSNVFTDADHTKLNGIEANATADQTKSDIDALGINATQLDSLDSTQFLRSDTADTKTAGDLTFSDNVKANFGASNDLQIYHDGTNSFIKDNGTGGIFMRATSNIKMESTDGNRVLAQFIDSAGVDLYYNNGKKLATTSGGVTVTGNVVVSGTVDGRDVASDGSKLDGIEANAKNDQTITAGNGLTGGGTGDVTVNVGAGTGIDVGADSISVDVSDFMSNGSNNRIITATGADAMNAESNLTFDGSSLNINGNINDVTDIYLEDQIFHAGDTDTYMQFHASNQWRVVTGGTEMLEVNDSYINLGANSKGSVQTTNVASSITPNMHVYNSFVLTLTGNITLGSPTTEVAGMSGVFVFIHSGAGRTVSVGAEYETVGGAGLTLSGTSGAVDIVPYYVRSSGNIILGTPQLAFS